MRNLNLLSLISKISFMVLAANLIFAACRQIVISQTVKADRNNFINTAPMNIETFDKSSENKYYDVLSETLAQRGVKIDALCNRSDALERRILEDYGAVFLARHDKVLPPPVCIFTDAKQVL